MQIIDFSVTQIIYSLIIFICGYIIGFKVNKILKKRKLKKVFTNNNSFSSDKIEKNIHITEQKDVYELFKIKLKDFERNIESKNKELKLSELKYKTLIEDSSIGVAIFDGRNIIYSNDSLARIFGLNKASRLINRDISDFLVESSQNKIVKRLDKLQNGEKVPADLIIKIKRSENSIRTLKLRVSDITINLDKLRHATFMDITEQIEADKELKKSKKELTRNLAQKDKFFSIIAHDLKNPLNSLLGFIELLKFNNKKYDDTKRATFIDLIESNAKNISTLLENLLIWSRSQRGLLESKPEMINLNEELENCIILFKNASRQKEISITNKLKSDLLVHSDKNMLNTILRNLISNAIKFTDYKGEIITNALINNNNNGTKYIEITIADNGVGIEKNAIKKLFRIDQNYSSEGTNKEQGSGLGLLLCKEFVEKIGGQIMVESNVGLGSIFRFTIPAN